MKPTTPSTLGLSAATGIALGLWLAIIGRHGALFALPVGMPITLGLVAIAEWFTSRSVRDRLTGAKESRSIDLTRIPSIAALARASSMTAALSAGTWLVLLIDRIQQSGSVDAAQGDAVVAGAGLVTSVLLVLAALRLEWVCRAPRDGSDERRTTR